MVALYAFLLRAKFCNERRTGVKCTLAFFSGGVEVVDGADGAPGFLDGSREGALFLLEGVHEGRRVALRAEDAAIEADPAAEPDLVAEHQRPVVAVGDPQERRVALAPVPEGGKTALGDDEIHPAGRARGRHHDVVALEAPQSVSIEDSLDNHVGHVVGLLVGDHLVAL